jgi:hypothetical protein
MKQLTAILAVAFLTSYVIAEDKPLDLAYLVTSWRDSSAKIKQIRKAAQGNQIVADEAIDKLHKEWDSWDGKPFKGTAVVVSVKSQKGAARGGIDVSRVQIQVVDGIGPMSAKAKDADDPILAKLMRGQVINIEGTVTRRDIQNGGAGFQLEDCTYSLPKKKGKP